MPRLPYGIRLFWLPNGFSTAKGAKIRQDFSLKVLCEPSHSWR